MTADARRLDLATLASHELVELGARVRRCADDRTATFDEIARAIVDTLWAAFEARATPPLALVRLYRARHLRELPPELRDLAPAAEEGARGLVLVATRGIEPAWDEVAHSVGHRVLPLSDAAARARAPMVGKLVTDLALDAAHGFTTEDVFFVPDAVGSPFVPEQRGFVLRYGVRSVVGCGGALPDGAGFALLIFSRVLIEAEAAGAFGSIGLHAALALSRASDLGASALAVLAAREHAMDRLLRLQEYLLLRRLTTLTRESEELRGRVGELERTLADQAGTEERRQERTQRAMLNVIEDLREARRELEVRVAQRTLDLQRSNAELRSSNAELEQFAYVASHDLQEPLRTIAGYLQLIQERYGDRLDVEGHEFISYAVGGARRLQDLIEALLAYSQVSRASVEMGVVSLDRALDEALDSLARAIGESRASIERDPLPSVRGDPVLLRQLFQNLVANAIKFCGPRPPRIEVRARRLEREVALTIRDHGIGFDPKYAEQVFKVFRRLQRKLPGTGIGLAICKRIVERHGGTIRAEAALGQGASFHVALPTLEVTS